MFVLARGLLGVCLILCINMNNNNVGNKIYENVLCFCDRFADNSILFIYIVPSSLLDFGEYVIKCIGSVPIQNIHNFLVRVSLRRIYVKYE